MAIASKQAVQVKTARHAARIKAQTARIADLLGDFSEQTGALFG